MKKPMPGLLLLLALIGLAGCYNNAHLRTQQLLEPGEKVVSGSGVLAVGDAMQYGDLNNTGVSGLRGEVSSLTGKQGGESGPYFGLGLVGETAVDIIAGYEIKRYTRLNTALPWKLGLQAEGDLNLGGTGYGYSRGLALHLRPSYTSTTTRKRPFYGGLHGLVSLGNLESQVSGEEITGYDEYEMPIYRWYERNVGYQFYSYGAGVTAGCELIFQMSSIQLQVDASWMRGHFSSGEYAPPSWYSPSPSSSTFMVTGSVGLNLWRPRPSPRRSSGPYPALPARLKEVPLAAVLKEPQPRFDPVTGLPVEPQPETSAPPRFDPETGLPLTEVPDTTATPRFDPETGLPVKTEPEAVLRPRFNPVTGELIPPEPAITATAARGKSPLFTETTLRIMARNNAKKSHYTAAWGVGGGLLGCGGMFLGSMLGAIVAEFPGFILGAATGSVVTAEGFVSTAPATVPIPEKLKSADPQVRNKYRQLYQAETRKLRRKSIYGGMAGVAAFSFAGLLFLSNMAF